MRKVLITIIAVYQRTLSPDSGWFKSLYPGGYCKYTPHCSEYCKQAIGKHGVARGSVLGIWRIMRCNPWSQGGPDPA